MFIRGSMKSMRTQPIAHGVFYANNRLMLKRIIDAGGDGGRKWEEVKVDLSEFAGHTVTLRLYQRVLVPNKTAGTAYWRAIEAK